MMKFVVAFDLPMTDPGNVTEIASAALRGVAQRVSDGHVAGPVMHNGRVIGEYALNTREAPRP